MKRILTMSNIHGYYDEMKYLLNSVKYNPKNDLLIILGGLVDFGPKSLEVVDYCIELQKEGAVILRGNREQLYINAFLNNNFHSEEDLCVSKNNLVYFYLDNPYKRDQHMAFFKQLPIKYETEKYVFSYAGVNIENERDLYYCFSNDDFYKQDINDDKIYVFGYYSVFLINPDKDLSVYQKDNLIGIDFGAGRDIRGTLGIVTLEPERKFTIISKK